MAPELETRRLILRPLELADAVQIQEIFAQWEVVKYLNAKVPRRISEKQGLMSEACEAVTDYWFDVLKFPVLRAPKAVANEGSRRISEKQGMRIVWSGEREYVSGKLISEVWEITAQEWRARKKRE